MWCRLPESNWRPFHYELSILVDRLGLRSNSSIKSCIENSKKKQKIALKKYQKKRYYECINEDIEMKNTIAMLAFVSATTFAQTTYYNNSNGTPLGTAQSAQPIQQAPITQFSAPSAPTFPTSPLFPTSPIGR